LVLATVAPVLAEGDDVGDVRRPGGGDFRDGT
jgi:hypothetical protein